MNPDAGAVVNESISCYRRDKDGMRNTASFRSVSPDIFGRESHLLNLPFEIRQKVYTFVLADTAAPGSFPAQSSGTRPHLSLSGGHEPSKSGPRVDSASSNYLALLCVCRQIHKETQSLPFQLNPINVPAAFGSNTTATKQFLDRLRPQQRQAVRSLEVRMLASVHETFSLKSILKLLAGADEMEPFTTTRAKGQGVDAPRNRLANSIPTNDLRNLTVHISTRDLLLAQADSYTGLVFWLNVEPDTFGDKECGTWVTEGLVHMTSLRKLSIVVEMSASVANKISRSDIDHFEGALTRLMPWIRDVNIEWETQAAMMLGIDDPEWEELSPPTQTTGLFVGHGHGHIQGSGGRAQTKAGFASWVGVTS